MCQTLISRIVQQKHNAESKYPDFARTFMRPATDGVAITTSLCELRRISDSEKDTGCSIEATLMEEVFEVFEAACNHDWDSCMEELSQVGSVVLRAMEWVQTNKLDRRNSNG